MSSAISLRRLAYTATLLLACWFLFIATQYTRRRLRMQHIASELYMQKRTFYLLPGPLNPPSAIEGEERLLVVGKSSENYLLCSIVRNPLYTDWRGRWKVDNCFRPDLHPDFPRLAVWEPMDHFPTEADLDRFRTFAMQQEFVKWDTPEGTDPEIE